MEVVRRVPKDGIGPRGVPDCYYTSRVLNSTQRYVDFVKKLRKEEDTLRIGEQKQKEIACENNTTQFFIRADRRCLINKVAQKVELCLDGYENDLNDRRAKLIVKLEREEKENIRKLVMQAQAGTEMIFQARKDRLAHLLEKRRIEHEKEFLSKPTPLTDSGDVQVLVHDKHAKECQQMQLYQMLEKKSMKSQERELDKMWSETIMREAEALSARQEYDAIMRKKGDMACTAYAHWQCEQLEEKRKQQREAIRQEQIKIEQDIVKMKEEEAAEVRKHHEHVAELKALQEEEQRKAAALKERLYHEEKAIQDAWFTLSSTAGQRDKEAIETWKKRERELVECNRCITKLQNTFENNPETDKVTEEVFKRDRAKADKKRCAEILHFRQMGKDARECCKLMTEQNKEKRQRELQQLREDQKVQAEAHRQIEKLWEDKEKADAAKRKECQREILEQIANNEERRRKEIQRAKDEQKAYEEASKHYEHTIRELAYRPYFSEQVHRFYRKMTDGSLRQSCPCCQGGQGSQGAQGAQGKDYCDIKPSPSPTTFPKAHFDDEKP